MDIFQKQTVKYKRALQRRCWTPRLQCPKWFNFQSPSVLTHWRKLSKAEKKKFQIVEQYSTKRRYIPLDGGKAESSDKFRCFHSTRQADTSPFSFLLANEQLMCSSSVFTRCGSDSARPPGFSVVIGCRLHVGPPPGWQTEWRGCQ